MKPNTLQYFGRLFTSISFFTLLLVTIQAIREINGLPPRPVTPTSWDFVVFTWAYPGMIWLGGYLFKKQNKSP